MSVDPSVTADPLHRPAEIGRRVGAYLIDSAIALVVLLIAVGIFAGISFASGGAFPLPLAAVLGYLVLGGWIVVYSLMQAGAGSLGMRILGLRLARVEGEGALGFGPALWRNVVWWLGSLIVVGMFSPLFDASPWRRGWHDRTSGAVMVDVAGRGPAVPAPVAAATSADAGTPADLPDDTVIAAPPTPAPAPMPAPMPPAAVPTVAAPAGAESAVADTTTATDAVISFVPGVTRPTRPAAPTAATPPIEVPPAGIPIVDAPAPAAVGPSTPALLDDPLDQTRLSTDERPLARLVWDDGTRQALYGRTVFGRNPAAETGAMIAPVRDETLSLSKTHFELVPDPDRSLWVIDRHSTNGVLLRRAGEEIAVEPGVRVRVRTGDVLEFGDRHVTIQVAT